MNKVLKKLFGGLELTWPKVIIASIIMGVYTAAVAIIPALKETSFHTIAVTFEVWILFGIIIIMNSKGNLDAALKCFVFFLISQPLVYLIQVPFSWQGWGLFGYYKYWFIWTVLCLPMGFIGYWMKKGKWWGYLILLPMILLTEYSYLTYLSDFLFYRFRFILICIFCIVAMILYPIAIFENKKIRTAGVIISVLLIIAGTALELMDLPVYETELLANGTYVFDDSYSVYLEDESYGEVSIIDHGDDFYSIHGDLKKGGRTTLTLVSPEGEKTVFDLKIEKRTYEMTEIK